MQPRIPRILQSGAFPSARGRGRGRICNRNTLASPSGSAASSARSARSDDRRPAGRLGLSGGARSASRLKHEFSEFTTNLLDQLAPHYLAPTPSVLLAQVQPVFGDPALRDGKVVPRGAYLDAAYRELERNIACRFALCAPIHTYGPSKSPRRNILLRPGRCKRSAFRSARNVRPGYACNCGFAPSRKHGG